MIMENEQLECANKILYSKPKRAFDHWLLHNALDVELYKITEVGCFPLPDMTEVLEQLVNDELISRELMEDQYDFQEKFAYSITAKGYDLISEGITYEVFLKNKEEKDKKEEVFQNRKKQQQKYWWLLSVIAIIISILALIFG